MIHMIDPAPLETQHAAQRVHLTSLRQRSEFGLGSNLTVLGVTEGLLLAMSCMIQVSAVF